MQRPLTVTKPVDYGELLKEFNSKRVPDVEQWRQEFGRGTTLVTIANALSSAHNGYMRDLTDLGSETIDMDPHLASTLGKRLRNIAGEWEMSPSEADDIDPNKARFVADVVRDQITALPDFNQSIKDLAWGLWNARAALEKHWERRPGERVPFHVAELAWIHPRRLSFGPERELRLIDGNIYPYDFRRDGVDLRVPHKFITFTPRLFNEYPEREGLCPRGIYWAYFKRFSARERMVLLELFGKPWRIVEVAADATADTGALDEAFEQADALGGAVTARFPKGIKLNVEWPDPKNGELHNVTIADCDRQISKLILGGTGTTDAESRGLNDNTANVHADEQQKIRESDGDLISQCFQRDLAESIVVVNAPWLGFHSLGEALRYVPRFRLNTSKPEDRNKQLDGVRKVIDMGIAVPVDQVRTIGGVRKPKQDEAVVQMVESPQDDMSARFIPPRSRVIDPQHTEPGQTLDEPPTEEEVYHPDAAPQTPGTEPAGTQQPQARPVPKGPPGEPAAPEADASAEPVARGPNPDDDDDWELFHGPIMSIPQELAALDVTAPSDVATNFPQAGANMRPSLKNSRFRVFPPLEAEELKREWPEIWKLGGSKLANLAFRRLLPVAKRIGKVETDTDEETVRLREAWASAHYEDSDAAGIVGQVKWLVVGAAGIDRMRRVIAEAKARIRERDAGKASDEAASLALEAIARQDWAALNNIHGLGSELRDRLALLARPSPGIVPPQPITLPFAGYKDFDACVIDQKGKGHDDESARSICGALQTKIESERTPVTASVQLAKQPSTVHGSPESVIDKGLRSGLGIIDDWAHDVAAATDGATSAREVRAAIRRGVDALNTAHLSAVIQERMVHAAMLGALDADWEAQHDDTIAPVTFAGQANFATKPFAEAIRFFGAKRVVTKTIFERLFGAAKRAAFTIAGLAKKEMLQVGFDEVAKVVERGEDLRKFRKALNTRFDSAGWTRLNSSHVETVFRNATMGAYSSGRKAQMTQPHVLRARPYWQIVGPRDDRQREPHAKANGKVLRASDPFWRRAPLPWGHNCRHRTVSRSEKDIKRLGLEVVDGSTLKDLPDPGWDSSISLLV